MARPASAAPSGRSLISSLLVGLLWLAAIYMFAVAGCTAHYVQRAFFPAEKIVSYNATKPEVLNREHPASKPIGSPGDKPTGPTEIKDRMLAAIVLHDSQAWFFKVSGSIAVVSKHAETFASFMESVHFDGADAPPHWKLPDGWEQKPGAEGRFATLQIPTEGKPLDLSVTSLSKNDDDDAGYLLANVNRWRGQLSLPLLEPRELAKELKEIKIEGAHAYLVDMSGALGAGGMGRGPFAGGPFSGGASPVEPSRPVDPAGGEPGLSFKTPEGWLPGRASDLRRASFMVKEGKQEIDISVSVFPAAINNLRDNVNRWRRQMGLGDASPEELKKLVREIEVGGVMGQYVDLREPAKGQPGKALLGVVAFAGDDAWFVKLIGDAELVEREKAKFEAFVGSIQFSKEAKP